MSNFIQHGADFESMGNVAGHKNLFKVNEGVSVVESLNWVACILAAVDEQIHEAAMGNKPLEGNSAWLAQLAMESSRGVLRSVISTLDKQVEQPKVE